MLDFINKVPELTEDTFTTWRPAIEACLCQRSLWRVVIGKLGPSANPTLLEPAPPATLLTNTEIMHNTALKLDFDKRLEAWKDKDEKAQGKILAAIACTQRVHLEGATTAYLMWQALLKVHMQSVPRTCFSAYNELFSIVKDANETLPAVAARVKQALARVKELQPIAVTAVSAGAQTTLAYSINHLDDELALMAMLRALPRNEYGNFVSLLMRTKDLTHRNIEAAFQVEQTKCNAAHRPLISPTGNKALRTQQDGRHTLSSKSSLVCTFCNTTGHTQD